MARVNIEDQAWTDPRFAMLAQELGIDKESALCRFMRLVKVCTEMERHEMPAAAIRHAMGHDRAVEALVASDLAAHVTAAIYYVKGTKDRIEWLGERRAAGKRGGKKSGEARRKASLERQRKAVEMHAAKRAESERLHNTDRNLTLPNVDLPAPKIRSQFDGSTEDSGAEAQLKHPTNPLALALALAPALDPVLPEEDYEGSAPLVGQELAAYLLAAIRSHTPRFATTHLQKWADDLRLLVSKDGVDPQTVRDVIDFVHRSDRGTWHRKKICGGRPLRASFGSLLVDMSNPQAAPARASRGYSAEDLLGGKKIR